MAFTLDQAKDFVGQTVEISGWMYNKRGSGKVQFLQLRDGTGFIQAVLGADGVSPEKFEEAKNLRLESSIKVRGKLLAEPRSSSGFEMHVSDFDIIQIADEDYPIGKKEHGVDFLLGIRHLWHRVPRQRAIMRIRNEFEFAVRKFFYDQRFVLIDTPILTGSIGESAGELFSCEYFDQGNAYLSQTGQLYLETMIFAHRNVYCFGPTFRAEKSKTRRHLTEFWMIEAERAFAGHEDNMKLQEDFVRFCVSWVADHCQEELKILERDPARLKALVTPKFGRLTYDEAIDKLKSMGSDIQWGSDLGADDETKIANSYETPVFVEKYPAKVKAFYMQPDPKNPDVVLCADLLAPEGYGEIIGGSERVWDMNVLRERIKAQGLPEESYSWYMDLRKYGGVPHSGFGLGLERTLSWVCGLPHLREASPYPRMMTRIYP